MLVVFEGGDRCGKTTQIELLHGFLTARQVPCVRLKYPDRTTPSGRIIDAHLKGTLELDNETITLVLTSNLWDMAATIDRELALGKLVLVDRHCYTNLAYSQVRGVGLDKLKALMAGIRRPDVVFYLRPADVSTVTSRHAFGCERYETAEVQRAVTRHFDEIFSCPAEAARVVTIDSGLSIDAVFAQVSAKIAHLIE